jgi:predicted nuclease with TOPRIM domain
LRAQ